MVDAWTATRMVGRVHCNGRWKGYGRWMDECTAMVDGWTSALLWWMDGRGHSYGGWIDECMAMVDDKRLGPPLDDSAGPLPVSRPSCRALV